MTSGNLRLAGFPEVRLEAFLELRNSFPWSLKNGLLDKGLNFCLDMFPAMQSLTDNAYQVCLQRSCVFDPSVLQHVENVIIIQYPSVTI